MNRNLKLEKLFEVETEIMEIQDAIHGMTQEVDDFVKEKDAEIKAIYDDGNRQLQELDDRKKAIVDKGEGLINEIQALKNDAINQLNEKLAPIYEKLEKEIHPKKNDLILYLMGIPKVTLPNSKIQN